jgi:hypothetical protein
VDARTCRTGSRKPAEAVSRRNLPITPNLHGTCRERQRTEAESRRSGRAGVDARNLPNLPTADCRLPRTCRLRQRANLLRRSGRAKVHGNARTCTEPERGGVDARNLHAYGNARNLPTAPTAYGRAAYGRADRLRPTILHAYGTCRTCTEPAPPEWMRRQVVRRSGCAAYGRANLRRRQVVPRTCREPAESRRSGCADCAAGVDAPTAGVDAPPILRRRNLPRLPNANANAPGGSRKPAEAVSRRKQ